MIYATVVSFFGVTVCHVIPRADGKTICEIAVEFLIEDFGKLVPPGYLACWPYQLSLLAVVHLLFRLFGAGNYQAFQYMNVLCYGEIPSITFTMVLMWQLVRYCKTGKKTCWIFGTLALVFACMMRMNSLIVLVAVGIVLVVFAIRAARPQAVVWLVIMLIAVFSAREGINIYYEKTSGIQIWKGAPYISFVRAGLHDTDAGPGWYDGSSYIGYTNHEYDTEKTYIDHKKDVMMHLQRLWEDKPYGIDFLKRKILTQWNSPDYHSIYETRAFDCAPNELPKFVRLLYYDREDIVRRFMNRYQFILYFCTAFMTIASFICKKKDRKLEDHILHIAIIGGFLFSIIWEAMSRYVFPYAVYMIPLAAVGMWKLREQLAAIINRFLLRLRGRG